MVVAGILLGTYRDLLEYYGTLFGTSIMILMVIYIHARILMWFLFRRPLFSGGGVVEKSTHAVLS